jgi:diguanylate cyclase (GGDEF)-like protein/PAS domain S-box-containing protein
LISFVRDRRVRTASTDVRRRRTAPPKEAALVAAPVGVFQTDADGAGVFVNDRWCEYTGISREASLGSGWLTAVHPGDRERVATEWAASVAQRRDFELEYRIQRPDGETLWMAGSATALTDPDGTISGYIGTVTNISGAVATRLALSEERQFVDTVLDIAGSLVCVFDPEGRFLRFNRACELVSGYTFEEIRGRPFYEFLIPADEIEAVRADLAGLRAGEPPAPNVNNWVTRDGTLRLISWLDVCFFDAGGSLTHIVSTGTDVTDERRAQEALRGIEAVGTILASHGPTPEAMATVLRTLADGMGYRHIALFLRDGDRLRVGAQRGYDDLAEEFDPNVGIVGRAMRTGEATLVDDVSRDPDYVAGSPDVTCEIAVPLVADGQSIGVLSIEATAEAPLTQADLRLAQTIAQRLSVAVVLGREQQAIADRARLFTALTSFAQTANSTLVSERMVPVLLESIAKVLPADVLSLVVLDRTTGRYLVRAVLGGLDESAIGTEIRLGEGVTGRALASRTMVFDRVHRSAYPVGLRDLVRPDMMSTAAVPLIRDGAMLGAIMLGRVADREPAFSALEGEAMTLLAAQTALALANAQLLEEVSELAIRDSLTGLYNRRHFDAALEHILRRYIRGKGTRPPVAAIMFDLDHFGRFNKDHGHQAGDEVLRRFAGILLERFRSSDLVARYGGEEFVAILEGSTVAEAVAVAEDIRRTLAALRIPGADGTVLRATVSAGSAALDDAEPTREALIRAADVGLFMAKRAGRNQVVAV